MGMTWDEIQAEVNKQREENEIMRKLNEPEKIVSEYDIEKAIIG